MSYNEESCAQSMDLDSWIIRLILIKNNNMNIEQDKLSYSYYDLEDVDVFPVEE